MGKVRSSAAEGKKRLSAENNMVLTAVLQVHDK